jgi:hypothetical protein
VHTVIADRYKRVRLPDAKPKQVFAYAKSGETITLTRSRTRASWKYDNLINWFPFTTPFASLFQNPQPSPTVAK